MDFMSDALYDKHKIKLLTLVDNYYLRESGDRGRPTPWRRKGCSDTHAGEFGAREAGKDSGR